MKTLMPNYMPKRVMDRLQMFETRPDDTFIVTPFKSGKILIQILRVPFSFYFSGMYTTSTKPKDGAISENLSTARSEEKKNPHADKARFSRIVQ